MIIIQFLQKGPSALFQFPFTQFTARSIPITLKNNNEYNCVSIQSVSNSEPLKKYKIYMDSLPQKLRHHRLIKDGFLSQKPTNELTKYSLVTWGVK